MCRGTLRLRLGDKLRDLRRSAGAQSVGGRGRPELSLQVPREQQQQQQPGDASGHRRRHGADAWAGQTHVQMADLELFKFDGPAPRDASLGLSSGGETLDPGGGEAPWTGLRSAARPEEETETSFTCRHGGDGDSVQLRGTQTCNQTHCSSLYEEEEEEEEVMEEEEEEEDIPELFLLSDDDLSSSDGSGKSVDYGFIIAVTCLVTGISLVAISYTVPRDVRVDPDSVSAREMERLEREKARVGAHLDRCVIAGLCLLTLGGVLLSSLLMVSMWKGEMMRRKAFAYSKHAANLYGSMSLRAASGLEDSCSHLSAADEDLEVLS